MGFETPEETKKAEELITPEQSLLSGTREKVLDELKEKCGLDEDTFNDISSSFNAKHNGKYFKFDFKVKGHKIEGEVYWNEEKESYDSPNLIYLDGQRPIAGSDAALDWYKLEDKYRGIILGLMYRDNYDIAGKMVADSIDELLK